MYGHIRQAFLYLKAQPLFFSSCLILSCLIAVTQYQFWFGDYSKGDLNKLKDEIALVELETDIIKKKNQELLQEKNKLNSGKEALEGAARIELGMIKPGEKFYVFKDETKKETLTDN